MPLVFSSSTAGTGPSLQNLAREVSYRYSDLALSTPSSGTQTTLVDQTLLQYFPNDVTQVYPWVYGAGTNTDGSAGLERRGKQWTASSYTLTLHPPGFPSNILTGNTYEIRAKQPRSRVVEALNDGIGKINALRPRQFYDTTLVGVQNQWRYTLPASQNWSRVLGVELQTATNLATYPYRDTTMLNWKPFLTVDQTGNELWEIQFEQLPPPGYILRVWGDSYYPDLIADSDTLAISGQWQRILTGWLYGWASMLLDEWLENKMKSPQSDQLEARKRAKLEKEYLELDKWMPGTNDGRVVIPGVGDGQYGMTAEDSGYLGSFSQVSH